VEPANIGGGVHSTTKEKPKRLLPGQGKSIKKTLQVVKGGGGGPSPRREKVVRCNNKILKERPEGFL